MKHLVPIALAAAAVSCAPAPERQPLPENMRCLSIDPGLGAAGIEATLDALDAWIPHPAEIDVSIGGSCPNVIHSNNDPYFTVNPAAAAATRKIALNGWRVETEIVIRPDVLQWSSCEIRELITHELGHFWGLTGDDHAEQHSASIMAAELIGCTGRVITERDRELLAELY